MSPHNRILLIVGGTAITASLAIGLMFVGTNAVSADLARDEATAQHMQLLGDALVVDVHVQRQELVEFLLSRLRVHRDRYDAAVAAEARTADEILASAAALPGVAQSLAAVDAENDSWRATIADPAIAAMRADEPSDIAAAIEAATLDRRTADPAGRFVTDIDAIVADLGQRGNQLDSFRIAATVFGLVVELLATGLSLWFVRRYGRRISQEGARRAHAHAERIEIIVSLRSLRVQATPEATAALIVEAMCRVPGVDVAAVFECSDDGMRALALVGLPGFPIATGQTIPGTHADALRARSGVGPWAERIPGPTGSRAFQEILATLGLRTGAFGPIEVDGELIGLVALATTDEELGRHLLEDLPAVGEFASVAGALLAPALLARRSHTEERRRIGDVIAAAAFRPVFQPVVDIASGRTVGFEALTRFDDGRRPDIAFAAASSCGLGVELECVTLEAALRMGSVLPDGAWLSLNVSPTLLALGSPLATLLGDTKRPIVLEITEHEAIASYEPLRAALNALGPSVRLAIDDVGAGIANFNHLVELRPTFIKIDAGLVRGVDHDPSRRAVVVGLVHFAAESRCQVIAEGIETDRELAALCELSVTLGQGFLLGRPAAAETWTHRPTVSALAGVRAVPPARAVTRGRRLPRIPAA